MVWIEEYRLIWRWAILILLILAIIGPWGFDRTNVPAEFACNPPHIRLEGDFCGLPISFIRTFLWMVSGFFNMIVRFITGEIKFTQTDLNFWISLIYSLISILLILPIFNNLFMIFRGDRPRFQKFHLVICGLDFCLILFLGIVNHPKFYYALWGLWLYILSLAMILILEGIHFQMMRLKDPG
jgi:hypothetical protein